MAFSQKEPSISLPAFTSALFSCLSPFFLSSCKQQKATLSFSFCHRPTHICSLLAFFYKFIKQFFSTLLKHFASKDIPKFQAQTYSTVISQSCHFIVCYYATQFVHILFLLFMGRVCHLLTAIRAWPAPGITSTSSFRRSMIRASTFLVPPHNSLNVCASRGEG